MSSRINLLKVWVLRASCLYAIFYMFPQPIVGYLWAIDPFLHFTDIWANFAFWTNSTFFGFDVQSSMHDLSADGFPHYFKSLLGFVLAVVTASIWSWKTNEFRVEDKYFIAWTSLFVRLFIGLNLFDYGFAKVIPGQFPELSILRLVQPVGEMSPLGLLWTFMGYSQTYSMIAGWLEVIAGILIIIPRLRILGALFSSVVMFNVFLLNLFYDVPVKLYSFHILLFSLGIFTPYTKSFIQWAILFKEVQLSRPHDLFKSLKWNHFALYLQLIVLIFSLWKGIEGGFEISEKRRNAIEKAEFYGLWIVEQEDSPLYRVVFDLKNRMALQYNSGKMIRLRIRKKNENSYEVSDLFGGEQWGVWKIGGHEKGLLNISGMYKGNLIDIQAKPEKDFSPPLLEEKFKWIQDRTLNR